MPSNHGGRHLGLRREEIELVQMQWSRRDWLLLVALTLLAALLRLYQLGSVPPGFQFDEAFNAIDATQVLDGNRPLFLPANAGREVVYTYFQAGLITLFGFSVRTLRLASALAGILAVPITYLLLRRMLRVDSRRVAFFTAFALAVSLWHIHFSHYGIRVITMPVIFSAAFGCFWLGTVIASRPRRLIAYVLSGLLVGLAVWTHPAGRFAPFVLLLYTLWLLWREPATRRLRLDAPTGGLALAGLAAFLVFLPLGIEFYRHPDFFFGHASEVSVFADRVSGDTPLAILFGNILAVLGMFSVAGDVEWTHNLAGRPVFDLALAAAFYLGVVLWAIRLFRRTPAAYPPGTRIPDPDDNALALLAIWTLVMLLPSVLSEAAPNYSRTTPALPALLVAAGLGLTWITRLTRPWAYTGAVIATLILAYSTYRSLYDYFVIFPSRPEVYYLYDADKLDALETLAGLTAENEVYLSQLWGEGHSTVQFLRHDKGIKSLDTGDTLVLPAPGKGAVYAFPAEQAERAEQLAALWPGVQTTTVPDRFGQPLLILVQIDSDTAAAWPPTLQPDQARPADFTGAPALLGLQAAQPDKQVTLFWAADQPMERSLTSYVHLIDGRGQRVAQIDKLPGNGSYLTEDWTPGERVIDRYYPALIDPCAGGLPLQAQVGWYDMDGHIPYPRADAPGETALAGVVTLPIYSHEPGYLQPQLRLEHAFSDTLTLVGTNLYGVGLQAGAPMTIDLYWRSTHEGRTPAIAGAPITLTIEGAEQSALLWSGELAPAADWRSGQEICRRIPVRLPAELPGGDYTFAVALGEQTVPLGTLTIGPPTRRFTAPPLATEVDAELSRESDRVRLLGLSSASAPAAAISTTLPITLVWQALTSPAGDYKVFIHMVDTSGAIVAQSDAVPGPDYPTNRWLQDEVVLDRHLLSWREPLPPGEYRVLAGLYDPISADRLTAVAPDGQPYPDNAVPLYTVQIPES